ncbi:MAG TPA: 4-hydroxy-tetrahydrodipicolinate synthase [Dongiaceae bacterium]|jgi:4-hydroxy-tetrahydrodipicolinate synthase|nr:4-hydroxy-tetrahydrodipicolinate synthase [Dongiaceae bacterium]
MIKESFRGAMTALVTPFDGAVIDESAYRRFIEWQIAEGIDGLVPCGTTGESPTLDSEEQVRAIAVACELAGGRIPVIAGAGTNDTRKSVILGLAARRAGADALLVIVPYYNKPGGEGLYLHFKHIHDEVGLPIVIYNNPARTIVDMSVELMARLAELPHIVGVKDASGDLARPTLAARTIGEDFRQLSGDDATALPFLAGGGHGCISVTANVAPALCAEMQRAWRKGDVARAQEIHRRLMPLHKMLFQENSPGPVKYCTHLLGFGAAETRLPLAPISETLRQNLAETLRTLGLLG